MNQAIVEAITQLLKEKDIEKDSFQEIIQGVFLSVIKKIYGESDNFDVIFNMEKGDIEIYCEKAIVEDDEVEDSMKQIGISKAREEDPDFEIGEDYVEIIDYRSFGRRAILAIKQNLIQRIKDIEKENLFKEFSERVGEIVIADIHQINRKEIRLNIDKTEVIMPRSHERARARRTRFPGPSALCNLPPVVGIEDHPLPRPPFNHAVELFADCDLVRRLGRWPVVLEATPE